MFLVCILYSQRQRCYSSTDSELELETTKLSLKTKDKNDICRKTLRLTSEQIVSISIIILVLIQNVLKSNI